MPHSSTHVRNPRHHPPPRSGIPARRSRLRAFARARPTPHTSLYPRGHSGSVVRVNSRFPAQRLPSRTAEWFCSKLLPSRPWRSRSRSRTRGREKWESVQKRKLGPKLEVMCPPGPLASFDVTSRRRFRPDGAPALFQNGNASEQVEKCVSLAPYVS